MASANPFQAPAEPVGPGRSTAASIEDLDEIARCLARTRWVVALLAFNCGLIGAWYLFYVVWIFLYLLVQTGQGGSTALDITPLDFAWYTVQGVASMVACVAAARWFRTIARYLSAPREPALARVLAGQRRTWRWLALLTLGELAAWVPHWLMGA